MRTNVRTVRPRPANMSGYEVLPEVIGSPNDPYERTTYRVWMDGHSNPSVVLVKSSLDPSNDLWIDGIEASRPRHLSRFDREWNEFTELVFEAVAKVRPDDLDSWEEAEFEREHDAREAERAAGWDPNP